MGKWIEHWDVMGTSGKTYRVSRAADGSMGCDCPAWIFQKKQNYIRNPATGKIEKADCNHILKKRFELQMTERKEYAVVPQTVQTNKSSSATLFGDRDITLDE